jgi:hypothetical protein
MGAESIYPAHALVPFDAHAAFDKAPKALNLFRPFFPFGLCY